MGSAEPASVETGTSTYYVDRLADFLARWPDREPPSYYANYGDKCLHQFLAVEPRLTVAGQHWLKRTLRTLQDMMEAALLDDPGAFATLELDGERFDDFAFSTHAQAYLSAGLLDLPLDDLWKIVRTPSLVDLLTKDGVREIVEVFEETSMHDLARIFTRTFGSARP